MTPTLRVNEIFRSIQGESSHAGRPCAFVRLAGCDVGCAWCDTPYAVHEPGRELALDFIVAAVRELGPRLAEITGGEPLLQPAAPELAYRLAADGFEVLVETSGAHDIRALPPPVKRIVDVKCPASGVADRMRRDNLFALRPGDEVKFVLADRADYEYARAVIDRTPWPEGVELLLSTVTGRLDPAEVAEWLLHDALPVRLQVPLHKILWPADPRGK